MDERAPRFVLPVMNDGPPCDGQCGGGITRSVFETGEAAIELIRVA